MHIVHLGSKSCFKNFLRLFLQVNRELLMMHAGHYQIELLDLLVDLHHVLLHLGHLLLPRLLRQSGAGLRLCLEKIDNNKMIAKKLEV